MRDFPAGTYSWEGKASTGYMRYGPYTGTFTVEGTCPTNTNALVSFAQPIISTTNVDCSTTLPRTPVTFGVNPPEGGYVQVIESAGARYFETSQYVHRTIFQRNIHMERILSLRIFIYARDCVVGTFVVGGTCPIGTGSTGTTSTTTTTPPPPVVSPSISLLPVSFRVITATMCTIEKNATQVVIEVEPASAGTVAISKEGLGMVNSSTQGVQYLPNGTYTWQATPKPGYTVLGVGSGTLTLPHVRLLSNPSFLSGVHATLLKRGFRSPLGMMDPGKPISLS